MDLAVGRVTKPHGVRGEVCVQVCTDDPEVRFAAGTVLALRPPVTDPLTVTAARWHDGRLLVRFAGVDDREHAEALRRVQLVVDSSDAGDLAGPDEFRDYQLIGLRVLLTSSRQQVGVVTDVLHPGQDLLVVTRDGGAESLVPFVSALVPEVDLAERVLFIDPPPGLLDIDTVG